MEVRWRLASARLVAATLLSALVPSAPDHARAQIAIDPRWSTQHAPKPGPALAIGGTSSGCLQGAVALDRSGPGYHLVRPSRRRWFGHPSLIAYVQRLGATVTSKRLGVLFIGDIAQARGGPTPTGHRSHQSGLDVDIWYTPPRWALRRSPTAAERERLDPPAVVDLKRQTLTTHWQRRLIDLLAAAAIDPGVDRIFVHPAVKRELCARLTPKTEWLRRVRPWWGHHDHFHVRLRCPAGNAACQAQEPLPDGDGCGGPLAWWFSTQAQTAREQRAAVPAPALPAACEAVLE